MAIQFSGKRRARQFRERLRMLVGVVVVALLLQYIDPFGRWKHVQCASLSTQSILVNDDDGRARVVVLGQGQGVGEATSIQVYSSTDQFPTFNLLASKTLGGGRF